MLHLFFEIILQFMVQNPFDSVFGDGVPSSLLAYILTDATSLLALMEESADELIPYYQEMY